MYEEVIRVSLTLTSDRALSSSSLEHAMLQLVLNNRG